MQKVKDRLIEVIPYDQEIPNMDKSIQLSLFNPCATFWTFLSFSVCFLIILPVLLPTEYILA